jgi:hypothetical protein
LMLMVLSSLCLGIIWVLRMELGKEKFVT